MRHSDLIGRINSLQSLGAADGPGIRYTVFLQGCSLRCAYCHNPDTWVGGGTQMTASEIFEKIMRCVPYFGNDGGVTVSGGEPLLQGEFVTELFSLCKENGINTALDTSGFCMDSHTEKLLSATDLVMCDIKFTTEELYKKYTGGSLESVLLFLETVQNTVPSLWVRHVVVPDLTDTEKEIKEVIRLSTGFKNLKKIELLPFRSICKSKYDKLGIEFPLENTPDCTRESIEHLRTLIPDSLK